MIALSSEVGCATHARPHEHSLAEVQMAERHAEEVALNCLSYSDDLETARAARKMARERAIR